MRSLPCPEDIFNDVKPSEVYGPGAVPVPSLKVSPQNPKIDPHLPPAPPPALDPATSVIRDNSVNPASARIKYTEEDQGQTFVEQAKAESKTRFQLFGKKPKKIVPASE